MCYVFLDDLKNDLICDSKNHNIIRKVSFMTHCTPNIYYELVVWEAKVLEISQHRLDKFSMLEDQQVCSTFVSQGKHTDCVVAST